MKWMKRTALALAAGAALSLSAGAPSSAAPVGQSALDAAGAAVAQSDSNPIEVRRGRGHRHGRRHGWRHHRHHRSGGGWWVPFVVAPFLYEDSITIVTGTADITAAMTIADASVETKRGRVSVPFLLLARL